MSNEQAIVDEIRARLADDHRAAHPQAIAISEQGGTVTLRGSVSSPHERHAAVQIAQSVCGVHGVTDELHVDVRDHWEDNEIRGAALQALISNPDVPDDRIELTAAYGWLTLKGEVKHQSESDAAFEAVRRLPGVGGITNRITVTTAGI